MKRVRKKSHSVYRMLVLSYIAMLLISLLFAAFGYRRLYEDARLNTEQRVSSLLAQSAFVVDGYVDSVKQSLNAMSMSTTINSFVYTKYPMSQDNYYSLVQTIREIKNVSVSNNNLKYIALYVTGIDSLVSSTTRMSVKDYYNTFLNFEGMTYETWREEISRPGYFITLPVRKTGNGASLIGFVQSLPLTSISGQGAAVAYLDASKINDILASGGILERGSLLIESDEEKILTIGEEKLSSEWKKNADGTFSLDIPEKSHLTVSVKGKSGWSYHCAISSDVYLAELKYMRSFIVKMLIIELIGGMIFAIAVATASYSPLKRLVRSISASAGKTESRNEYEMILNTTADILNHNSALTDRLRTLEPMIRSNLVHRLLMKNHGISLKRLQEFGISFTEPEFSVMLIALPVSEGGGDAAIMSYSLISLIEDRFRDGVNVCAVEYESDTVAVIFNCIPEKTRLFGNEVHDYIEKSISVSPIVCVGSAVLDVSELYISASEADEAMDYAAAWNKTGVTRFEEMKFETGMHILGAVHEQELGMYLRSGDEKNAETLVRKLFMDAESEPLANLRILAYGVITTYLRVLGEWKIRLPIQDEIEKLSVSIGGDLPASEISARLPALAAEIARTAGQFKSGTFDDVSEKIMEIIRTEYADSALSLTVISQKLDMNSSYLSHVFKQQTGTSFIDALNGTRMENAKTLLLTTDLTVQEISEKCGYTSASYFIRVFKKQCGQTPVQYKTEIGSRNE